MATALLPDPEGGTGYEPFVVLDPSTAARVVVAAMVRGGGTGQWLWTSQDTGRTWHGERMPGFEVAGRVAEPAQDVMVEAIGDGTLLLGSMATAGTGPEEGGIFVRRWDPATGFGRSVAVVPNRREGPGAVVHDRPWMVVDRNPGSPRRGTVYLTVGTRPLRPSAAGIGLRPGPVGWGAVLSVSTDSGRTFGPPRLVADSALYGSLAIAPDGAIEMVEPRAVGVVGAADAIRHRRSTDGGATFGPPTEILAAIGDTVLELPTLAIRPNGDLLTCWSEGVVGPERVIPGYSEHPARFRRQEHANRVRCAEKTAGGGWSLDRPALPLSAGVTAGFPTIVGTARGWYLMAYLADSSRTEVALLASQGGAPFARMAALGTAPGLPAGQVCFSAASACARERSAAFRPGDVVSLVAESGRLAAAFVLPRSPPAGPGAAALHLSVIAER